MHLIRSINKVLLGEGLDMLKKVIIAAAIAAASVGAHADVATFEDAAALGALTGVNNSGILLGGATVEATLAVNTFSSVAVDGLYFSESTLSNLQVWDLAKATSLNTAYSTGGTNASTNGGAAYSAISTYMAALGTTAADTQTSGNWIGGLKSSANSFSFKSATASTFALDSIWLFVGKTTTSSTAAELTITGYDASGTVIATYTQLRSPLGAQTITLAALEAASANFASVASITVTSKDGYLGFDNITTTSTVLAVPEPSSYAMLLAGLGMMGFMVRRRTKA
jgi:hypothetical protein